MIDKYKYSRKLHVRKLIVIVFFFFVVFIIILLFYYFCTFLKYMKDKKTGDEVEYR